MDISLETIENFFRPKVTVEVFTELTGTRIYNRPSDEYIILNDNPLILLNGKEHRNVLWHIFINGICMYIISYIGLFKNVSFNNECVWKKLDISPDKNGNLILKNIRIKGFQMFID
jgi:hypothetical protein